MTRSPVLWLLPSPILLDPTAVLQPGLNPTDRKPQGQAPSGDQCLQGFLGGFGGLTMGGWGRAGWPWGPVVWRGAGLGREAALALGAGGGGRVGTGGWLSLER